MTWFRRCLANHNSDTLESSHSTSTAAIVTGETDPASSTASKGLPNFWLQAMQNHGRVAEYIEEADVSSFTNHMVFAVTL